MWSFTTEAFEFPTLRLTSDDAGGSQPKPRASSSSSPGGGNSYARDGYSSGGSSSSRGRANNYARDGSSLGGSNQTPSPSTVCTRGGVQDSFSSGDQSLYHGSLDDLEADFDEGSTERMESLVSGLLQDEGREYQNSCPVLPSKLSRVRSNSRSSSSVEAAHRSKELQTQYENRFENNSVSGSRRDQSFHLDCVGSTKVSAGIGFPSTEMVFPHEETLHMILKQHESSLRASVLGSPAGILDDNGNLRYLSGSQQNGSGHINPEMLYEFQQQMTRKIFRDIQQRYVDQEHLEAIEARRRQCITELQVVESMEIMRERGLHVDCAADGGQVDEKENLRKQDNLVHDLRVLANSIQNSLVKRSAAEQTNEARVGFCNWFYQRGCPTSDIELEKVKNYIREVNRVRSHAGNLDSLHSNPAAGHLWSQRTLGTGFSSPLPKIINNDTGRPASAKSCSASAGGSLSAISELPGRGQSSYARSRRLGTNSLKKPEGYCNFDSPPRRKASPHSNSGHLHTSRAADNNSPAKIVSRARTGFHPRSPISVGPPIKCAENGQTAICFPDAIKGCHLSKTALPEQKSSKYLAEFDGEEAGRIDGNSVPLQNSPATKALIARGEKSISVVLTPETAAPRARCPYPASSCRNASALVPTGSGSPSSRRQLKVSDDDALQLIPIQHPSVELDVCNQGQFKTELCNNWQATQYCPYGDHCRFAHGVEELRCVLRHPRYKTIPCRMIMHGKACIYGHRCHFRHSLTTEELSLISIIDVHDASL